MKQDRDGESRRIFSRYPLREDVDRELESHVAMRTEELVASGLSPDEAEREARSRLGERASILRACVRIVKSHQRAVRRANSMDALLQDLRYGFRTVMRSPGFAALAMLTLALGVGANSAIFSVVNGVLLRPLPYQDADELMVVAESRRQGGTMQVAWANFVDWHEQSSTFEGLFAHSSASTTVLGGESPLTAQVAAVSLDVWATFGVVPIAGRLTAPGDHVEGAPPVVVVSERFWRNELAGRPIEGMTLTLSGFQVSVVGVAPAEFDFPVGTAVWRPLELTGQSTSRTAHNYQVVGRLAEGVSQARAQEEMDALTRRLVQAEPDAENDDFLAVGAQVWPLQEQIVGSIRTPLLILLGAAGLVLLVACTNLASTLLARGAGRSREFAVRASLGAGQMRLVRQLLTESGVLALGGAVAGIAFAAALVAVLQRLGPGSVPRLAEVGVDGGVLGYTAVVSAATMLLFGLFPALRLSAGDGLDVLRSGSRGNAGGRRGAAWTILVGSEVALALVLLVGSGLLVRSFQTLLAEDGGFDASDVVSTPVTLSLVEYDEQAEHVAFYDQALAELASSPAISSAAVMSVVPLAGFFPNGRLELDGDLEKTAVAGYVVASTEAFDVFDVPLLRGRTFERTDDVGGPHVAIVSESFAQEYWPGENPIGRRVTGGGMDDFWESRDFAEVVGVVGDVRYSSLGREPIPTVYFPYSQRPFRLTFRGMLVAESSNGDPGSAGPTLRSVVQRLDPDVPVSLMTQEALIDDSVSSRRFTMLLLVGFSLVALVLAIIGIYGVVSYTVAQRRREMGIRLALGADPGGVVAMVVRSAMGMVVLGLAVGGVAALLVGRLMGSLLYEVGPTDPVALVAAVGILATAALLACWVPAYGGTRVDPMITMRQE